MPDPPAHARGPSIKPPKVVEVEVSTEHRDLAFPCANCGAALKWDPGADAMTCAYCKHVVKVPRGDGVILERPLDQAGDAARGLGLEVRVTECDTCGARVTFDTTATAESCVYCGSANVLAQEANRNALRPESLVPLDVSRAEVQAAFRQWLDGLWFRPSALRKTRSFDAVGIYVPFWSFDCQARSDWHALAGYYYYVTETYTTTVNGKTVVRTRTKRKIRWEPASGRRHDRYDDLLFNASPGLPQGLVHKLGEFDTSQLVPYRPEYLAGWRAEEYQVDLEHAWKQGQDHVATTQRRRCAGDVPGDTHADLRVRNVVSDVRWKHLLLPIWSVQYRFRDKTYTVLVHGQNGRIAGDAPLSWKKILGLVFGVIAAVLVMLTILAIAGVLGG